MTSPQFGDNCLFAQHECLCCIRNTHSLIFHSGYYFCPLFWTDVLHHNIILPCSLNGAPACTVYGVRIIRADFSRGCSSSDADWSFGSNILAVDFRSDIEANAAPPYISFVKRWHVRPFLQLLLEIVPLVVILHSERSVLKTLPSHKAFHVQSLKQREI